ncbi:isoaspartyl peptidase/L-asparaginase, partial [Pricia sp.]|uniref:isoaspartyl peptidase/L-asparaginase n=1 Tax=Pricia sp. TaxID=2268138 RepID=UPI003593763F
MERRKFLKNSTAVTAGLISVPLLASSLGNVKYETSNQGESKDIRPIVICTWDFHKASAKAWDVLKDGGNSLDAVEEGVKVEEADVDNQTVGVGGRPDRDGNVTLDACIMDK